MGNTIEIFNEGVVACAFRVKLILAILCRDIDGYSFPVLRLLGLYNSHFFRESQEVSWGDLV